MFLRIITSATFCACLLVALAAAFIVDIFLAVQDCNDGFGYLMTLDLIGAGVAAFALKGVYLGLKGSKHYGGSMKEVNESFVLVKVFAVGIDGRERELMSCAQTARVEGVNVLLKIDANTETVCMSALSRSAHALADSCGISDNTIRYEQNNQTLVYTTK